MTAESTPALDRRLSFFDVFRQDRATLPVVEMEVEAPQAVAVGGALERKRKNTSASAVHPAKHPSKYPFHFFHSLLAFTPAFMSSNFVVHSTGKLQISSSYWPQTYVMRPSSFFKLVPHSPVFNLVTYETLTRSCLH